MTQINREEVTQIVVPAVASQVIQVTEETQTISLNTFVTSIKVESIIQHIYINPA